MPPLHKSATRFAVIAAPLLLTTIALAARIDRKSGAVQALAPTQ
jgi:hypothetical protein